MRVRQNGARSVLRRDDSNLFRLTTFEFSERLGGKLVEPTFGSITLDLSIPSPPVILHEPVAECGEFFRSQLLNCTLESFNVSHDICKCTTRSAYSAGWVPVEMAGLRVELLTE